MKFAAFHRSPFLRLLFPFVAGIFFGDEFFFLGGTVSESVSFLLFLAGFLWLAVLFRLQSYSLRWLFGASLFVFLFGLGAGCAAGRLQAEHRVFSPQDTIYCAVVMEQPETKANSVLCRVTITRLVSSEKKFDTQEKPKCTPLHCCALLYLSKDSLSEQLVRGDELLVYTRFSLPATSGNPDEFDYARYLIRKGISGTGFARSGYWKRTGHAEETSFRQQALNCRERVLAIYRGLGLNQENFAVLSALTVGYKEELGEEIRESYSVAGASHVLALSGLHIGFLYALLVLCLKRLPGRWKGTALTRTGIILVALWAFAFFTGLSPSVVRSVCMFSLFALAGLSGRRSHSLNTLSVTAFFLLLCCPAWLFDVGFQLSFVAVGSILFFYPLLYRLIHVSSRAGSYFWGLICVSIAAQLGTAPLVLYYFSRFSTHFLLTNLLVIPLVSLIIYATVILLLLTPFPALQSLVGSCVKVLIEVLNGFVRWVEHLPGASVDGVCVRSFELLGICLLLFLVYRAFMKHSGKRLVALLGCLLVVCSCHLVLSVVEAPRKCLVFYNLRNCPVVHCLDSDRKSWLVFADTLPDASRLRRTMSRYWNRLGLDSPCEVTAGSEEKGLSYQDHVFSFYGCRVCILCDESWQNRVSDTPFAVDYLYVCKGYKATLTELLPLFAFRHVILDSSLSDYYRQRYKKECRQLGIHCLALTDEGSVQFLLSP